MPIRFEGAALACGTGQAGGGSLSIQRCGATPSERLKTWFPLGLLRPLLGAETGGRAFSTCS
jgi:hypothetical protein